MKLNNPFITAGYESPDYFCDREKETADLVNALENDRNVTLMAPRRYGKTGLIENVFWHLRKNNGYQTVILDVFSAQDLAGFTKMFVSAVFRSLETSVEKALSAATTFLKSCRPTLTIDPHDMSHKFSFDIAPSAVESTLEEVFGYLAKHKGRVVIALDEFQQILEFPEKGVEALLRSYVQRVPGVGFIFAGSRQHLMRDMFSSSRRPFFQSTQKLHLDVIDKAKYLAFAAEKFAAGGMRLDEDVFAAAYDRFDGITWYVQAVMNRLYGLKSSAPTRADVSAVVETMIGENSYDYRTLIEALPDGAVRLLRAIASEGTAVGVTSSAFIVKHSLRAPSSTSESLTRLMDMELVCKTGPGYVVYDRLLGEWLARSSQ